ncbi:ribosomal protein S10 [Fomitiporia mediterranea MF3/22]|uniref:ribosomal protein S10 n=1 Tax=Fomitiporia mediterranea (strain MF3/22) TaxID=694068 RepID=UPI00044099B6|nr:ribosomal protein S10 [Fomitiporia mediterranea MF3/22]EJD00412.1 ribosomal protein S10 [Fomitiporia mediterranea MF3/22]
MMLANQARTGIAFAERLLKQVILPRSLRFNGFATETTTTAQPSDDASLPTSFKRRRKEQLMVIPDVSEREYAAKVIHGRSIFAPIRHEKTHGIPVASLHVRGYNHRELDLFLHFASHAASALAIPVSEPIRLPTQRSLWTVPKGPFVHKKAQENFERKVHKRMLQAWDATDNVVEHWLRYIQTYPQPGVGLRIVRWHRAPLGIGKKHTERTSQAQLKSQELENITNRQRVEEVAKNIVKQEMATAKIDEPTPKVITQKSEAPKESNTREKSG